VDLRSSMPTMTNQEHHPHLPTGSSSFNGRISCCTQFLPFVGRINESGCLRIERRRFPLIVDLQLYAIEKAQ
jgi:hypothetical protein